MDFLHTYRARARVMGSYAELIKPNVHCIQRDLEWFVLIFRTLGASSTRAHTISGHLISFDIFSNSFYRFAKQMPQGLAGISVAG
jgi:hypothetical protein